MYVVVPCGLSLHVFDELLSGYENSNEGGVGGALLPEKGGLGVGKHLLLFVCC